MYYITFLILTIAVFAFTQSDNQVKNFENNVLSELLDKNVKKNSDGLLSNYGTVNDGYTNGYGSTNGGYGSGSTNGGYGQSQQTPYGYNYGNYYGQYYPYYNLYPNNWNNYPNDYWYDYNHHGHNGHYNDYYNRPYYNRYGINFRSIERLAKECDRILDRFNVNDYYGRYYREYYRCRELFRELRYINVDELYSLQCKFNSLNVQQEASQKLRSVNRIRDRKLRLLQRYQDINDGRYDQLIERLKVEIDKLNATISSLNRKLQDSKDEYERCNPSNIENVPQVPPRRPPVREPFELRETQE
uniref:Uncharacterized protein n=1 Tax=Strongyloides stercoralis TaxID=6248 RepID=A0A0K0ERN5_STRER